MNLTNIVRDTLVHAATEKLRAKVEAVRETRSAAAYLLYEAAYAQHLDAVRSLPDGALPVSMQVSLWVKKADGGYLLVHTFPGRDVPVFQNTLYARWDTECLPGMPMVTEDSEAYRAWRTALDDVDRAEEALTRATERTRNVLAGVRTLKVLKEQWPKMYKLYEKLGLPIERSKGLVAVPQDLEHDLEL